MMKNTTENDVTLLIMVEVEDGKIQFNQELDHSILVYKKQQFIFTYNISHRIAYQNISSLNYVPEKRRK